MGKAEYTDQSGQRVSQEQISNMVTSGRLTLDGESPERGDVVSGMYDGERVVYVHDDADDADDAADAADGCLDCGRADGKHDVSCSIHTHTPVAGMMHVHDEDLDTVADSRGLVECDQCDMTYTRGRGWH